MRRVAPVLLALCLSPAASWAHCDRIDGPVANAAREALRTRQPATVLIWVGTDQDAELRAAYEMSLHAQAQGHAAADLAERYLVETAVRLHREAEGLPFAGVRSAATPLPRVITTADEALASGHGGEVSALLGAELTRRVGELFEAARALYPQRNRSVEDGRRWVDAYVRYLGYVDSLRAVIEAGPEHGVGHHD